MERDFMKTGEVAQRLGVSRGRVNQMVSEGLIPFLRRGRIIVVPTRAWNEWLDEQNRLAASSIKGGHHAEAV